MGDFTSHGAYYGTAGCTLTWFVWSGWLSLVLLPHLTYLQLETLLRGENVTVQHLRRCNDLSGELALLLPLNARKSIPKRFLETLSLLTWKFVVACVLGNQLSFSWNNCITSWRRCSNSFRWPFSPCSPCPFSVALIGPPPERNENGRGVFGVRGDFSETDDSMVAVMAVSGD